MEELEKEATGGAISRVEENRSDGMAWLARRLSRHKQLRPGVSITEAAHVLWIAASFEAFDLLYTGRGLSADKTARILVENTERSAANRSVASLGGRASEHRFRPRGGTVGDALRPRP